LLICAISVGAGHGKGIRFRLMTRPRHAECRIFAAQSQGLALFRSRQFAVLIVKELPVRIRRSRELEGGAITQKNLTRSKAQRGDRAMRFLSRVTALAAITLALAAIGSTGSLAQDGYELAFIAPPAGGGITAFRINVATGQVSNVSGASPADVKDPQAIPAGKYRLYTSETPDNKAFWLYRLETQTGRTWFYSDNSWTEIK
jgi:hypothetical protein